MVAKTLPTHTILLMPEAAGLRKIHVEKVYTNIFMFLASNISGLHPDFVFDKTTPPPNPAAAGQGWGERLLKTLRSNRSSPRRGDIMVAKTFPHTHHPADAEGSRSA